MAQAGGSAATPAPSAATRPSATSSPAAAGAQPSSAASAPAAAAAPGGSAATPAPAAAPPEPAAAPAASPPGAAAELASLDGDGPAKPRDNSSAEAAKAIAAARAAASQRLLEAARKRARNDAVPQPIAPSPSQGNSARRRAPPNLVELPPAAGEVVAAPREVPTLQAPQIIVNLPEADHAEAPRPSAPPPVPAGATAPRLPVPPSQSSPPGASRAGGATVTTQPMRGVADGPRGRADDVKQTEEVELVAMPTAPRGRAPTVVIIAGLALAAVAGLALPRLLAPPPPPVAVPAPPPPDDSARLLGEIDRSLDVQDWRTAVLRADQVLRTYPGNATAQDKRRRAEAELQNQFRFDSFRAAVERRNNEAALALFAEIPEDSFYKQRARAEAQALRGDYVQGKLNEARAARRLGVCAEVLRLTQAVLALEPGNEEAQALEGKCEDKDRGRAEAPRAEPARPEPAAEAPREARAEPRSETPRRNKARSERGKRSQDPPIPSLKDLRDPFRER